MITLSDTAATGTDGPEVPEGVSVPAAPSFSISGRPQKSTPATVTNGEPFWPDPELAELQASRTLPADLPADTAAMALLAAVAEVNATLAGAVDAWKAQGYERAADVPGARLGDDNQLTAQYKKAVYARAKADLLGEFATIGRREVHPGQESADAREILLAEAALVIRNILGYRRAGVHII